MSDIEITVFRKAHGILSKRISLLPSGEINSDGSECRMSNGTARAVPLDGVESLADLIESMPSNEALALGRLRADQPADVSVILKSELNDSTLPGTIARTGDYLNYMPGEPAYMLLDHDGKGMPTEIAAKLKEAGGFWPAVTATAPDLAGAARVHRRSTSAGLYRRDKREWLSKSAGMHVYIAVQNGVDIERALKTLHDWLWLVGYGYFVVGAIGQLLDRSIIDAAVFGPERLVFEGAPILVPPVAQSRKERQPKAHDGDIIDTAQAIRPLSSEEMTRVAEIKAVAKERLKPAAVAARKIWAREFAARHGMSEQEAERIATQVTNHLLATEFELDFDNLGVCTVADVLVDPDKYVGESLADPLEGAAYGRNKAKVFCRADRLLMIHSYAHGEINYQMAGQGVRRDDFIAYMQQHNYYYTPTRDAWPGSSVDARLPPVPLTDADGNPLLDAKGKQKTMKASAWLDRNRPVEQITWAPGMPMLILDRHITEGGWSQRLGVSCLNLYRPSEIRLGDANEAGPWWDHVNKIYPDDADHIIKWLAQRVQRPQEKINHALVLGGVPGIGKDSLLAPGVEAVGRWNCAEVSPRDIMSGAFNGFVKSVILRVNEVHDLGDYDRYAFYDHMKAYTATPPEALRVNEKHLREYHILNCVSAVYTTNYKTGGLYLPADDRRHYVAWSDCKKEDFDDNYFPKLWQWYEKEDGMEHVAAYLSTLDISAFDAKAPPPKTAAFWEMVDAGRAPEEDELADVLDALGNPDTVTLEEIIAAARSGSRLGFSDWLQDRKNRRLIPHRMEACHYRAVRNPDATDGMWKLEGRRIVIYAKDDLPRQEQLTAVSRRPSRREEPDFDPEGNVVRAAFSRGGRPIPRRRREPGQDG